MASNLRVDTIFPSTGSNVAIGTASGSVTFVGDTDISTNGDVTIGGNLGIGGTLTYEDVTNIDSVGVITARDGLRVTGIATVTGGVNVTGVSTFTSDVRMRTSTSNTDVVIGNISQGNFNRGTLAVKASADANGTPLDANIYLEERDGAEGYTLSVDSDGDLNFHNSGSASPTLELRDDNNVAIPNGNLVMGAGRGIDFSARTGSNAGATSSLLDDYEEGVYQPTMTGSSGGSHTFQTYTHIGYTRIGRLVHIQGYININGGSLTGNLKLSLPFTVSNDATGHSRYSSIKVSWRGHGWSGNTGEITFAVQPNTTYGEFVSVSPNGSHIWVNNTHVNNSYNIRIGGCYITNS